MGRKKEPAGEGAPAGESKRVRQGIERYLDPAGQEELAKVIALGVEPRAVVLALVRAQMEVMARDAVKGKIGALLKAHVEAQQKAVLAKFAEAKPAQAGEGA